jgi:hypothetical protein
MSLVSAFGHLANRFQRARQYYVTERQIRALPFEIQKDIGWPQVDDATPVRRR